MGSDRKPIAFEFDKLKIRGGGRELLATGLSVM